MHNMFFFFQKCGIQPQSHRPDWATPAGMVLAGEWRQDVRRQGEGRGKNNLMIDFDFIEYHDVLVPWHSIFFVKLLR